MGREEILLTGGGGVQISTAVVEINWENAPQLKLEFPCDPATPLLGTCTEDGIPHCEDITHPCALLALSEYPGKGVSRDGHQHAPGRIRKMWDLYTIEFYSFARKK